MRSLSQRASLQGEWQHEYTIIESAKRHGHEPAAYLKDVLERLPGMKAGELDDLLPSNRKPGGQALAPQQIAG